MAEILLLAGAAVAAPVLSQAVTDLYSVVKDTVSQTVWCNTYCQDLKEELDMVQPIVDQIPLFDLREEGQRSLQRFKETLVEGRSLVATCLERGAWANPFQRYCYSREFLKLRQKILQHVRNLSPLNTLQLQQGNQDLSKQLEKLREDLIDSLKKSETTPFVDWVRQAGASGSRSTDDDERLGKRPRRDEPIIQEDQVLFGLDNRVSDVKKLLLSGEDDKMVMIVGGMGGIGKTTLAIAICNDPEVKGFFEDGIHFFTVSQSPDMKALLSRIWEKIVGNPVPLFQNEEDAYRQVKSQVLNMPAKGRLLVLDDVWSRANLEKLSFGGQGLKTMITTRQAPTLETHQSHTYNLGLLDKENAQSLFCRWAFGEDSIPSWVEEPLVVAEVIAECKCLPLALKVIGASLSSDARSPRAWHNARDKLREAKSLGEYHEEALQQRLQTSIDALNDQLRDCFLDLGACPEDSQDSADALLDVWVYVRGMSWDDAVFALVELGRRCLLDFDLHVTSADFGHALEWGSATNLVFSQHDVMRDLALHLGRKGCPPSQCRRLLMPQSGYTIPKDWQSETSLAAQLISINISLMKNIEVDWPATLAFPNAEALILNFNGREDFHFPPFIQSMCKLKVVSIMASGGLRPGGAIMGRSFEGLTQLQSIQMRGFEIEDSLDCLREMGKLEKLRLYYDHDLNSDGLLYPGNLRHLCIWNTRRGLPQTSLQNLEVLQMEDCISSEEGLHNLGQLSALKKLSLRNYDLLTNLPESIGNLSSLETVDLSDCDHLSHLPESFGNLSNLKTLDLGGCRSVRHLPESFGNLSSLKALDLSACHSLSHLPESFGNLSSLETLDLSYCYELKHLPMTFELLISGLRKWKREGLVSLETVAGNDRLLAVWNSDRGLEDNNEYIAPSAREEPRFPVRMF